MLCMKKQFQSADIELYHVFFFYSLLCESQIVLLLVLAMTLVVAVGNDG